MPNPTMAQLHLDTRLSNVAIAYWQDATNFIATRVFPIIAVDKQSGKYPVFDKGDLLRAEARLRAPGTESKGGGFRLSDDTYYCANIAYHQDVPTEHAKNADFALDSAVTRNVNNVMLLTAEYTWAMQYIGSGIWNTNWQGKSSGPSTNQFLQWDQASAIPAANIEALKLEILGDTGFEPNCLVLTADVYAKLLNCADVVDRVKYTGQGGFVSEAQLAQYFKVPYLYVLKAVMNSAAEGATASVDFLAKKQALLCYKNPNPNPQQFEVSAGYTFNWRAMTGNMLVMMRKFELEKEMATRYEGQGYADFKKVAADLGARLYDVIA